MTSVCFKHSPKNGRGIVFPSYGYALGRPLKSRMVKGFKLVSAIRTDNSVSPVEFKEETFTQVKLIVLIRVLISHQNRQS